MNDQNTQKLALAAAGGTVLGLLGGYLLGRGAASRKINKKIKLKYWNGRGLMEVPRKMLAVKGRFPGEAYTDGRYSEYTGEIKNTLAANLGRMPCLEATGAGSVGQSPAINYFVAAELDMLGDDNLQAAQILSVQETLREMAQAYEKMVPYGTEPTDDQTNLWFSGGARDRGPGPADGDRRSERFLSWYLGRLEDLLDNASGGEWAIGDRVSLADIYLHQALADVLTDDQAAPDFPQYRRQPFGSAARMQEALKAFPRIKGALDKVAQEPGLNKWLSTRGKQGF